MDVSKILSLLPESLLTELADDTAVNRYSKKLQGELVFKLLLHCILSHKDNSLRTMESAYESIGFNILNAGRKKQQIRYSSISERLSTINPVYFEKIYHCCLEIYGELLHEKTPSIIRFDSTIVALSSKLLKVGYHLKGGDADHMRQLKFTIGYSDLPIVAKFYSEQNFNSENVALRETILSFEPDKNKGIHVFDRGLNSRKTYDTLTEKKIPFVTRANTNSKIKEVTGNSIIKPIETSTLLIIRDTVVYMFSEGSKIAKHPIRFIKCVQKSTNEQICFVSNIYDLSAESITTLYRQRWDIEVFFKFLKQELNFSHLINRSENGIRVMLYATLIAATLLLVYKKKNNLNGYKIMKLKFVQELEKELVKNFVKMCGGDPKKVDNFLNFNSS
ncbi:MAG: IS4 family transposase [Chitinophagales bacterium]|nr:IS4 family transposase [Chitinophagales bacterium]